MFVSKSIGSPLLNRPISTDSRNAASGFVLRGDDLTGINNNAQFIGDQLSKTFIPFNNTYSYYFNGTSSYTVANHFGLQLGSDDFTIEAWVYNQAATGTHTIFSHWSSPSTNAYQLIINSANRLQWQIYTQNSPNVSALDMPLNAWTHVAWSKTGTTAYLFINGVLKDTTTGVTNTANGNATNPWVGIQSASAAFSGYISNLRVVKGYALYLSDFTPPTTALTNVPGTTLLTCQSSKLVDNAVNATITMTGTVAVSSGGNALMLAGGKPAQGANSPYKPAGYWSNYFNGSTDYLAVPTGALVFGANDFTVETWVNTTAFNTSGLGGEVIIDNWIGANPNYVTGQWQLWLTSSGIIEFQYATNATTTVKATSTATVSLNTWNHIAVVRSGSTITVYLNGVSVATSAVSISIGAAGTSGIAKQTAGGTYYYAGYISNVRINKGTALYSSTFTPSATPLTAVSGTQLLTCQSNRFLDNSTNSLTITLGGTPSVQPYQPFPKKRPYNKYIDGSSCYFDGSSYISSGTPGSLYQFGTNNWTIEAWVYPTATGTTQTVYQIYGTTNDNLNIQFNGTTKAFFTDIRATNQTALTATSTVLANLNQWNHVALVRDSATTVKLYVNGLLGATATIASTTTFVDTQFAQNPTIGAKTNTVTNYFTGYVSNLRVINGTAVYTGAFTPPTSPVLSTSETVQLTNFDNANIIDSGGRYHFCQGNQAAITGGTSTSISKFGQSSLSFIGSTDYINFGPTISIGTNPYTFECWFYLNTVSACTFFGPQGSGITNTLNIRIASATSIQVDLHGTSNVLFTIPALVAGRWYHIAVTRDSSNITNVWINGTRANTGTSITVNYSGGIGQIGALSTSSGYFPGYIDDFRIIPNNALYTANFTPPLRSFEDR